MGQILPFIARVQANGDWTAAERAGLDALAERLLAAGGGRVEVIYGVTDEGDPWCVVKDQNEDILVHVARIDGRFVIHSFIDDVVIEDIDLQAALREQIQDQVAHDDDDDVVVPFTGRHAQSVLALLIAAAFVYETGALAPSAHAAEVPPFTPDEAPDASWLDLPSALREEEAMATTAAATADEPHRAPAAALAAEAPRTAAAVVLAPVASAAAPVTAAASAPVEKPAAEAEQMRAEAPLAETIIHGSDDDDVLTGGDEAEWLIGGDGDDTLSGGGGRDLLDGGVGDDRIYLTEQALARGGEGADTFVIRTPVTLGDGETLLGHVTDLNLAEGDQLVTSAGDADATVRIGSPADLQGFATTGATPPISKGRVEVDLNGDGVMDGYLVLRAPKEETVSAGGAKTGWAGSPGEEAGHDGWVLHTPIGYIVLELNDMAPTLDLSDTAMVGRLLDAADSFLG